MSPIDGRRDDYNAAMIAATVAAGFSGQRQSIEKHLLKWGRDSWPSWKEVEEKMMVWARKHNENIRSKSGG